MTDSSDDFAHEPKEVGRSKVVGLFEGAMARVKLMSIYEIVHTPSGKRYIGSAVDTIKRWDIHRSALRRGIHHCAHLQHAWNKHGELTFTFAVVEPVVNKQYLVAVEQTFIDFFSRLGPLYNASRHALTRLGATDSPETRAKRSASLKGHTVSAETRLKIGLANRGVKQSTETIKKKLARWVKPIIRVDPISGAEKKYDSIKSVAEDGFIRSSVSNCLAGRHVTHHGYVWKRAE
jgi:group I intron endonuclease